MKRLLFVITTSDFGGTENFLYHLVTRIDRARFEPFVCSLCPLGRVGQRIADAGVPTVSLELAPTARLPELWSGVRRLAELCGELRIDLIQPLLYRANMLAVLAARRARNRPLVISGQRSLNPRGARLTVLGVQLTRRLADGIIAVSPAVRDEIVRTERIAPERIEIIRNGVDTERYRPSDDGEPARERWGVSPQDLVIGAVGRLSKTKGFHHLLEAIALLRQRQLEPKLLIAGTGPEEQALRAQAADLELGTQVRLLGYHADLQSFYSALDIFALTSLAEGSPNALLEAMASGCAVIATAVGGVTDIVGHEANGLLLPPSNPEVLADRLQSLIENRGARHRLGQAARETIETRFSLQRMVEQHEAYYARRLGLDRPESGIA